MSPIGARRRCRKGPWLYPADQAADIPSRLLAAEITREKLYLRLHDELPYATTVETEKWEETQGRLGEDRPDHLCRSATARRRSCWARAGGDQGHRRVRAPARWKSLFGRRVHLFLFVKVREDWAESREHYREIGLEFPEDN